MDFLEWIKENKEWLFSWIWVTAIIIIWNIFFNKWKTISQIQTWWESASMQQVWWNIINK